MAADRTGINLHVVPELGQNVTYTIPDPAAGSDFQYVVPQYDFIAPIAIRFDLTTDVGGVARRVVLDWYRVGPAVNIASRTSDVTQAAGLAYRYNFFVGGPPVAVLHPTTWPGAAGNMVIGSMPELYLGADFANFDRFQSNISGMALGDTLTDIYLTVRRFRVPGGV